jgi:23S rRNA pseudouridine2605 synthase
MSERMRVQRALARAGFASRRAADALVAEGRVTINGQIAAVGSTVDPNRDRLAVDGKEIGAPSKEPVWLALNKPAGVMTTRSDPDGRPTVFDIVPDYPGLTYVGRLDYLTEGLILFTTDGRAAHHLTHPSREIERTYMATVRGDGAAAVRAARAGIELEDGFVRPSNVEAHHVGRGLWQLEITLAEGRNREVRRICEALGLRVERLVRTRFGPVKLGNLPVGTTRKLTRRELDLIAALVKDGGAVAAQREGGSTARRRRR